MAKLSFIWNSIISHNDTIHVRQKHVVYPNLPDSRGGLVIHCIYKAFKEDLHVCAVSKMAWKENW